MNQNHGPCPFCGGNNLYIQRPFLGSDVGHGWQVSCLFCDAKGPVSDDSEQAAWDGWNQRANYTKGEQ